MITERQVKIEEILTLNISDELIMVLLNEYSYMLDIHDLNH